jgi:methionyl-tRNA synthetase
VNAIRENIAFEDFQKMDIRIATILEAERIPKTKKLLKLKVDTGADVRTVVSGIAESYNPEDAVGKTVIMLANLAPREIKGVESQGMILMAENANGELSFLTPDRLMNPGNEVK